LEFGAQVGSAFDCDFSFLRNKKMKPGIIDIPGFSILSVASLATRFSPGSERQKILAPGSWILDSGS
jgi:hypothetical protein